jgi:hypothetical protein
MVLCILLESFPFILLGVVISAWLQTFVSDQPLQRWIPKKQFPAFVQLSCKGMPRSPFSTIKKGLKPEAADPRTLFSYFTTFFRTSSII